MNESQHPTIVLSNIDFILHAKNQRGLIHILTTYSSLQLPGLSGLLNIPEEKLISVLDRRTFLSELDAKKLAEYFCIFCGG